MPSHGRDAPSSLVTVMLSICSGRIPFIMRPPISPSAQQLPGIDFSSSRRVPLQCFIFSLPDHIFQGCSPTTGRKSIWTRLRSLSSYLHIWTSQGGVGTGWSVPRTQRRKSRLHLASFGSSHNQSPRKSPAGWVVVTLLNGLMRQ